MLTNNYILAIRGLDTLSVDLLQRVYMTLNYINGVVTGDHDYDFLMSLIG